MADTYDLLDLLTALEEQGRPYYEFIQRDTLSAGIYHLPAGEPDRQQPHTEDEVYYVLAGEGRIDIDGELTPVRPGSVIFVARHVPHRFVDYPEGITLLVIFGPARGSNAPTE